LRVLEGVELAKLIGVVRRARWQPAK
jgi:hypothetical protein